MKKSNPSNIKLALNVLFPAIVMIALFISTFSFHDIGTQAAPGTALNGLLGNKSYTLELAEAMPADLYTFRPNDSIRSFGEQMAHIGMSTPFLLDLFINGQPFPSDPSAFAEVEKMEKKAGQSKEECIKMLNEAFDILISAYKNADKDILNSKFTVAFDPSQPEFTKDEGFEFVNDHIIHHRSQALVSLRMQGIPAPQYRLYAKE